MWEFFIKNNKFAYLFLVALIGVGSYSLIAIPKESAPEVVIPVGIVTTILPGAPAADVESLVTNEIERGLTTLENVKKITSSSREGVSSVTVEFEASADIDTSIQDLKDEVDTITQDLPSDAEDPFVSEVNFVDQPVLTIALSADISDFAFTELARNVERELETVAGVSRVETSGVKDRQVTVVVNQASLLRYNLTINDVASALSNANRTVPIGQIENNGVSYNIAFEGDISDSSQIQNIGVASLGGQPVYIRDVATVEDGLAPAASLSRLSVDGKPSLNAVTFNIYKQSGGNITTITKAVNARVAELQKPNELLDGITSVTVIDAGAEIQKDLVRLTGSGLQTVILVVLLLVITIGWREGLLAGTAIPLSFLFGFIGLYLSGNTINFLSLFSLILGIGILVDSAIVMVEGINKKMKDNPTIDKKAAALETIREFRAPLISGTLTTVAMFAGLFIVSGIIGQFIASIPFTLIFLLFASLFVSLAIIPLFASGFLRRRSETKLEQMQVEYAHKLESWYRNKLHILFADPTLQWKFLALLMTALVFSILLAVNMFAAIIVAPMVYLITYAYNKYALRLKEVSWRIVELCTLWFLFIGSLLVLFFLENFMGILLAVVIYVVMYLYKRYATAWFRTTFKVIATWIGWFASVVAVTAVIVYVTGLVLPSYNPVKVIFFEQSDVDYIIVEIENPEGTTKEVTDIGVRRVEEVLYNVPDFESFSVTVGSGSQFGSGGSGEKLANFLVNLKTDRTRTSTEIVEAVRAELKDIRDIKVTVNQPSDGPPTGAAIIVKFLGDDLTEITSLANQSAEIFRNTENVENVDTSTNNNNTEFVLELDRAKATSLGLNPFTISQIARTAVFGTDATSLTTLDEDIDVVVKLNVDNATNARGEDTNIATIDDLTRITIPTQSGGVPLSSLVSVSLRESSTVINHEDSKRVVSVTADVAEGGNAREIQTAVLATIESSLQIPDDVEISTGGGETDESNQAFIEMGLALIVGIGLMVGILTLQFNSYLHMRYVLSILPYSLIGILVGLALTQNPLSFPSIMGFIALSGIVVNNSILLIDMMNQLRRQNPDKAITDVVIEASTNRLRPILLTTLTTVIGMLPLTYAGDLWAPLAYAVMFGLVFSVLITLLLIPIMYNRKPGTVA